VIHLHTGAKSISPRRSAISSLAQTTCDSDRVAYLRKQYRATRGRGPLVSVALVKSVCVILCEELRLPFSSVVNEMDEVSARAAALWQSAVSAAPRNAKALREERLRVAIAAAFDLWARFGSTIGDAPPASVAEALGWDDLYEFQQDDVREQRFERVLERELDRAGAADVTDDGEEEAERLDRQRLTRGEIDTIERAVVQRTGHCVSLQQAGEMGVTPLPDDGVMAACRCFAVQCRECKMQGTVTALGAVLADYDNDVSKVYLEAEDRLCAECAQEHILRRSVRGTITLPADEANFAPEGDLSLMLAQAQLLILRGTCSGRTFSRVIEQTRGQHSTSCVRGLMGLRPNPLSVGLHLIGMASGFTNALLPDGAVEASVLNDCELKSLRIADFNMSQSAVQQLAGAALHSLELHLLNEALTDDIFPATPTQRSLCQTLRLLRLRGRSAGLLRGLQLHELVSLTVFDAEASTPNVVNDEALMALGQLPLISVIRLRCQSGPPADISDAGFIGVSRARSLTSFGLRVSAITGDVSSIGIDALQGCRQLHSLGFHLRNGSFNRSILPAIARLSSLRRITCVSARIFSNEDLFDALDSGNSPAIYVKGQTNMPRYHDRDRFFREYPEALRGKVSPRMDAEDADFDF
jgi:hypothetical protein